MTTRADAVGELIARTGIPVERCSARAGNVRTCYWAAGSGETLVLLHGGGAGAATWHPLIPALSAYFRVIVPDIVGFGESDKPSAPYDRPFFSQWLWDFLCALGLNRSHLAGLSMGGPIAVQFCLDHAERVDRLVLIDSAGLGKEMPAGAFLGLMWLNSLPSPAAGRFMNRYLVHCPDRIHPAWADYAVEVCRKPGGTRVFWQGRGAAVTPIPADQLRSIAQPTLIVWGEKERFYPLAHAEMAAKIIPNAQLCVIPGAGHIPFFDQPQAAGEAVIRFLSTAQ